MANAIDNLMELKSGKRKLSGFLPEERNEMIDFDRAYFQDLRNGLTKKQQKSFDKKYPQVMNISKGRDPVNLEINPDEEQKLQDDIQSPEPEEPILAASQNETINDYDAGIDNEEPKSNNIEGAKKMAVFQSKDMDKIKWVIENPDMAAMDLESQEILENLDFYKEQYDFRKRILDANANKDNKEKLDAHDTELLSVQGDRSTKDFLSLVDKAFESENNFDHKDANAINYIKILNTFVAIKDEKQKIADEQARAAARQKEIQEWENIPGNKELWEAQQNSQQATPEPSPVTPEQQTPPIDQEENIYNDPQDFINRFNIVQGIEETPAVQKEPEGITDKDVQDYIKRFEMIQGEDGPSPGAPQPPKPAPVPPKEPPVPPAPNKGLFSRMWQKMKEIGLKIRDGDFINAILGPRLNRPAQALPAGRTPTRPQSLAQPGITQGELNFNEPSRKEQILKEIKENFEKLGGGSEQRPVEKKYQAELMKEMEELGIYPGSEKNPPALTCTDPDKGVTVKLFQYTDKSLEAVKPFINTEEAKNANYSSYMALIDNQGKKSLERVVIGNTDQFSKDDPKALPNQWLASVLSNEKMMTDIRNRGDVVGRMVKEGIDNKPIFAFHKEIDGKVGEGVKGMRDAFKAAQQSQTNGKPKAPTMSQKRGNKEIQMGD